MSLLDFASYPVKKSETFKCIQMGTTMVRRLSPDVFPLLLKQGIKQQYAFYSKHQMTHMLEKSPLAYFSRLH